MAAGQQKRRFNAASVVSCNLQEQYRAKKKKHLESCQNVSNMRPHISLEWDDNQKRAVASREQIGITWRDIAPFVDSVPQTHSGLADVFSLPPEIFDLEDMTGVLSFEVWETHLSESERNLLSQFLPRGTDVDKVVQPLLSGENLHFGNPFLEWGASLCSGDLHPDVVHRSDQSFKANKKAYYNELQKYHNDIVEHLLQWKDRWTRCKDPEKDIIQKMWRCSRKNKEKSPSSYENESRQHYLEENLAATSVSSPDSGDEKVCLSNKEITLGKKCGEPQERKVFVKHKRECSPVALGKAKVVADSRKEEKPHKLFIRTGDAVKYMSYFKISRKQHQLVKEIKQRGDGIQSKSLNRVLGDIRTFHVRPYEAFEEEERKKLHEHWLQVAIRDLPAAFADYWEKQLKRQQWRKSLKQELAEKKLAMDEDEENDIPESSVQEQDSGETEHQQAINIQNCEDDESVSISRHHEPLQRIPSLNSHHEFDPMVLDLEGGKQDALKQEEGTARSPSQFLQNMNPKEDAFEPEEASGSSAKDLWPAVGMPGSYYHPTSAGCVYASAGNLSLGQPQPIVERQMINLENGVLEGEAGGSLLHRPPSDVGSLHFNNGGSFFGSYVNQDRNDLLQPFLKGQRMLPSYPQEHVNNLKPPGVQFLPVNDGSPGTRRFPRQFLDQQQGLFEQRQLRERELYMQQMVQQSAYSNGRYPNQELFSPVADTSHWPADSIRLAPYQSFVNSGLLGQNWYSGGLQVSSTAGQCLGDGNSTDESLFNVLSHSNKLPPSSPYDPMSTEQYNVPPRNFVSNGDTFRYPSNQLNYLNGRETVAAMKGNNMSWMNLPHQNPHPHDSIGKPYLRSWNQ